MNANLNVPDSATLVQQAVAQLNRERRASFWKGFCLAMLIAALAVLGSVTVAAAFKETPKPTRIESSDRPPQPAGGYTGQPIPSKGP